MSARLGGFSEQALRDAWARFSEARPEELDWAVAIEVRQRDASADVVALLRPLDRRAGRAHEAVVTLSERLGGAPITTWTTDAAHALRFVDALTAVFTDDDLMGLVRSCCFGWREALWAFVWCRVLDDHAQGAE